MVGRITDSGSGLVNETDEVSQDESQKECYICFDTLDSKKRKVIKTACSVDHFYHLDCIVSRKLEK